jgi:hypothetical protein
MEARPQANTKHSSLLPSLQGRGKKLIPLFYSQTTYNVALFVSGSRLFREM